jgi:hypothetical protein
MTTLVTADAKGRIPVKGSKPGQKYLITQTGGEWRVQEFTKDKYPSRNNREWDGPKGKKSLFQHLKEMGDAGLEIEVCEAGKKPVPPCQF